jgi:hypothetical protein
MPKRQFIDPLEILEEPASETSSKGGESFALPGPVAEMQKSRPFTSDLFAASLNHVSPQTDFTSTFWTNPPTGEAFAARDMGTSRERLRVVPSALVRQRRGRATQKRHTLRNKRVSTWLVICSLVTLIVVGLTQGNGSVGAWAADTVRAIAGPVAAAQVEAWFLNAQNTATQLEYQLGWRHVSAPWHPRSVVLEAPPPTKVTMQPMPLSSMQPFISPALPDEGAWNVLEQAPGSYSYLPLDAQAFLRPDPAHPYAVVTLLQFDARFMRLHIVSGIQEPGGPLGVHGTGVIPQTDQNGNSLLAALNGGFKYADGAYGLMTGGKVYVPPQQGAGTIAVTRSGKLIIGAWGIDPQLNSQNQDLVAWRQNASLLIDHGVINPLTRDGAAWGGTILNSEYTWRSGLGITAEGNLVYAAGNALLPETLGKALQAAGAVMAIETDINPFWVRAFLYQRTASGTLTITKLSPDMQGTGKEYLQGDLRDFFYLTRFTPSSSKG